MDKTRERARGKAPGIDRRGIERSAWHAGRIILRARADGSRGAFIGQPGIRVIIRVDTYTRRYFRFSCLSPSIYVPAGIEREKDRERVVVADTVTFIDAP